MPLETDAFVRLVACGNVDDGKSTLIGRLLYESGSVPDDEVAALVRASAAHGTRGADLDFALLLDGLEAEREQGITIDVAWRHLVTGARRFLIADCPGHVQYTRNMATGASQADVAVMVVDVAKGLLPQTLQHATIVALLGVRHVVLAVNKMDRVDYDRAAFDDLVSRFVAHAARLGVEDVVAIPVSAALGVNVSSRSNEARWYAGPSVLEVLQRIDVSKEISGTPRVAVQQVIRDADGARWLAGTVTRGHLDSGIQVRVEPSGTAAVIESLLRAGVEAQAASAGDAVAVRLGQDVDAGRGDVLTPVDAPLQVSDQFAADVFWFDDAPLVAGRRYRFKLATRTVGARITEIKHRLDPESLQFLAAKQLAFNGIGAISLALDAPIAFASYREDPGLGAFILIDPITNTTVGSGMIRHGLRRADNVSWQSVDIDQAARAALKGHRARCIWFTGLSGAGKSTIANLVERGLVAKGVHTYLLDGDNIRHGLNSDLGFTDRDRIESQRRVSNVAKLMTDAGLVVIVSLISPFRAERDAARGLFATGEFLEVFVDTPLEVAERRDVKGLYAKARRGGLPNFTGIDSPYEAPHSPELVLDTTAFSAAQLAERVITHVLDV
ncbi:adenylyl-sulfate kinase [Luteimonas terrae]|uniref:Adenylyl-sulfate kinase n=1 Tax=Luteimonas terrae TaxID=1530191 RepID=A0A4R5U6T5_9GAMM|nr:adenylyl-sulfate kinase [Luteimonas terrae]TDK29996.1 adenylyl-sulfate kinase [Luteimonas terrae]